MNNNPFSLSKSTFVRGSKCVKALYLNKNNKDLSDPVSESTQALFDAGHEIGKFAQQLYPGGINSDYFKDLNAQLAVEKTQKLINNGHKVIYEAAFIYDECLAIIDILVYNNGKWFAYEVKSTTKVKDEHILDASYQYYIIKNTGIEIENISIIHLNNQYVREDEIILKDLFRIESVYDSAISNIDLIAKDINIFKHVLELKEAPEQSIGEHCSKPHTCDFWRNCWKHIPEYSVFDIANLRMNKKMELYSSGIIKMIDVPNNYKLNESQRIQIECLKDNKDRIDKPSLQTFLDQLIFPLYFLDFETIRPAIPLFDNSRPYQQLPFQFSLHLMESIGSEIKHYEHLGVGSKDPREELINQLISDIGSNGSIIVYFMSFEKTRIEELARDFSKCEKSLLSMIPRLVDLIEPFKKNYYYKPAMNGSNSIKDVLPALLPNFSYESLAINNGDSASLAFMKLFDTAMEKTEKDKIRTNLLEYCKLDTYAMVMILKHLYSMV